MKPIWKIKKVIIVILTNYVLLIFTSKKKKTGYFICEHICLVLTFRYISTTHQKTFALTNHFKANQMPKSCWRLLIIKGKAYSIATLHAALRPVLSEKFKNLSTELRSFQLDKIGNHCQYCWTHLYYLESVESRIYGRVKMILCCTQIYLAFSNPEVFQVLLDSFELSLGQPLKPNFFNKIWWSKLP